VSEFLDTFFSSMSEYVFEHPGDPQPLIAQFAGWNVAPERLAIYGRFVQAHVRGVLGLVYAGSKRASNPEDWVRWGRSYYATRPAASAYELNGAAEGFVRFLSKQADCPPYLLELARFEWAKLQVYHSRTPLPEQVTGLVANPTLVMLEHTWQICPFFCRHQQAGAGDPVDPPEPGDEVALIWRSPKTRLSRFQRATPRALLALKMAMESITAEEAAAAGGVPVANVEDAVSEWTEQGLILGPG
jgi:hypothetical protein